MQPDLASCESVPTTFHGQRYDVSVSTDRDALCIDVAEQSGPSNWTASFSAAQIEELTRKAGNHKKLPVFAKMLSMALRQETESAYADLLTPADLEAMRARKHPGSANPHPPLPQNKRYLILTYISEFDRVHYPLPLALEANPDPAKLKNTISRLRKELAERPEQSSSSNQATTSLRSDFGGTQLAELQHENSLLRDRLLRVDRLSEAPSLGRIADETATALSELTQVRAECEKLRERCRAAEEEAERRVAMLKREVRQKAQEAGSARDEAAAAKMKVLELEVRSRDLDRECRRLRRDAKSSARSGGWSPRSAVDKCGARQPPEWQHLSRSMGASPRSNRGRGGSEPERLGRSGSLGRPPRFDPTDFVKRRQERDRAAAEARLHSPARLHRSLVPPSGQSSPTPRTVRRSSSLERLQAATQSSRAKAGSNAYPPNPQKSFNTSRASSRPPTPGRAPVGSSMSSPRNRKGSQQENRWVPQRASRAASPSQALRDVKARLNLFVKQQMIRAQRDKPDQQRASQRSAAHQRPTPASAFPDRYERELLRRESAGFSQSQEFSSSDEERSVRRDEPNISRGSNQSQRKLSAARDDRRWRRSRKGELSSDNEAATGSERDGFGAPRGISDIDSRLRELQEFLRAAKANAGN